MSFGSAQMRDVGSLQNWLNSSGCLDREEGAYLTHHRDLFALSPLGDDAVLTFESWVEDKLIRFHTGFRKVRETPAFDKDANTGNRVDFMMSRRMKTSSYIRAH